MNVNKFYVLCGLPASGKTTFSKELAKTTNSKLHCFDDIPESRNPKKNKEIKRQMYRDIYEDLAQGFDVVLDDLHTQKEWRDNLLSIIKDIPCKKTLIVMTTPLEECLRRNKHRANSLPDFVIQILNQRYELPTLDEGWDEILYY